MKRFLLVLSISICVFGLMGTAQADHNPNGKRLKFEDCLNEDGSFQVPPDCTYDEDGHIIGRPTDLTNGAGGGFAIFIFFALLWAAIPPFIAATIASERGQSVGFAVIISIFLGWLGLAIVYFMIRDDPALKVATVTPAAAAPVPAPTDDSVTRMRKLQEMRDQNLITEAEFQERRTVILQET